MSPRALRRRYAFLYGLRWLSVGIIVPVLVLLTLSRGLSVAQVGVAFLPYALTTALLELPTGGLADSWGRRPVLLLAAGCHSLGLVAFGLSRSLAAFAISGAVLGVARALDSGPLEAWFVDATHDAGAAGELRRGLALGDVAECLALAFGSVVGGVLPVLLKDVLPDRPDTWVPPLAVPFLAAAAVSLAHAFFVAVLVAEPHAGHTAGGGLTLSQAVRTGARVAWRVPVARRLLAGTIAIGLALSTVELLWPPRLADLIDEDPTGASGLQGLITGAAFAAAALGAAASGRIVRRLSTAQSLIGLSLFLLAISSHVATAIPAYLLCYVVLGTVSPGWRERLHGCVDSSARSVLLSVSSLLSQGGGVVAKVTLLPLASVAGIPVAWAVCATAVAVTAAGYRRLDPVRADPETAASAVPTAVTATIAGPSPTS